MRLGNPAVALALLAFAATAVAGPCGPGNGSCSSSNGTPGCDDVECCQLVCSIDSFCCQVEWDQMCADAAARFCDLPGGGCPGGGGDCFVPNGSPGCDDVACCVAVCAADAFCCRTQWDSVCAGLALGLCGCPEDTNGDGVVDVLDLIKVISEWQTSDPDADVNTDGVVDVLDLVAIILAWGPC